MDRLGLIIFLLAVSGSFSGSETALFSLSRSELARFKSMQNRWGKAVIDALSEPRKLLVSIMLGNEVVNVGMSVVIASLTYSLFPDLSWQAKMIVSIAITTPILVVLGEVIPKNLGVRFASFIAIPGALFVTTFSAALAPLRMILLKLTDWFIMLFGGKPDDVRSMILEEEFRQMVELGCSEGTLEEGEGELIQSVFDMADKTVEEIMTPKEGMMSVSIKDDVKSAISRVKMTRFSRIPVYDADPDDIVGILHVRDMFALLRRHKVIKIAEMEDVIRPALFISQNTTIENLLRDFQARKIHMGIVVDGARKPVGVVTMDDIFGALFRG